MASVQAACVPKSSEGCSWGWLMSNVHPLERSCCSTDAAALPLVWKPGNDTTYVACSRAKIASVIQQKRIPGVSGSLNDVLEHAGYVRGPLRQLSRRMDNFLPQLKQRRILILHTRHPVEAMVSLYFCISNPAVCPIRQNVSKLPSSASQGLDSFLIEDLSSDNPGSHLARLLIKYEVLASLWQAPRKKWHPSGERPTILYSRYELMVEDFSTWLWNILVVLPVPHNIKQSIRDKLYFQYQGDFEPDGKHKHSLRAGSNLARLKKGTLRELSRMPRLDAIMQALNYSFEPNSTKPFALPLAQSRHSSLNIRCPSNTPTQT